MGSKEEGVEWPLGKPGGILLAMLFLPTVVAIFVQRSGFNFLPSNEWISKDGPSCSRSRRGLCGIAVLDHFEEQAPD